MWTKEQRVEYDRNRSKTRKAETDRKRYYAMPEAERKEYSRLRAEKYRRAHGIQPRVFKQEKEELEDKMLDQKAVRWLETHA